MKYPADPRILNPVVNLSMHFHANIYLNLKVMSAAHAPQALKIIQTFQKKKSGIALLYCIIRRGFGMQSPAG